MVRCALAFAIALLVPGLLYAVAEFLMREWELGRATLLLSASLAYPAILFGLPILWWMAQRYFLNASACLTAGAASGFLAMMAWGVARTVGPATWLDALMVQGAFALVAIIAGAIAGLAFWAIARPDHLQVPR